MTSTTGGRPGWTPDLLPGHESCTLELADAELAPAEPEGTELVATLVRRIRPVEPRTGVRRAVLYVHGWNDYFFQQHLSDAVADLGFDFHAVDLRRYGRSLRAGQLPGWITDLDHYAAELDAAVELIAADHDEITLMGHSTGGLVSVLWADAHPDAIRGLVLNSPWLDLQGSAMVRTLGTPILAAISQRNPTAVIPLPDVGHYHRTVHRDHDGEWDFDATWKLPTAAVRYGWLYAIRQGHARVAKGLSIPCPILVLASDRSDFRRRWDESLRRADIVLDVDQIARRAVQLGRHVTVARIAGAMHDVALSDEPARGEAFAELDRWSRAYL